MGTKRNKENKWQLSLYHFHMCTWIIDLFSRGQKIWSRLHFLICVSFKKEIENTWNPLEITLESLFQLFNSHVCLLVSVCEMVKRRARLSDLIKSSVKTSRRVRFLRGVSLLIRTIVKKIRKTCRRNESWHGRHGNAYSPTSRSSLHYTDTLAIQLVDRRMMEIDDLAEIKQSIIIRLTVNDAKQCRKSAVFFF